MNEYIPIDESLLSQKQQIQKSAIFRKTMQVPEYTRVNPEAIPTEP